MPKVILGEQQRRNAALLEYIYKKKGEGTQFRYDFDFAKAIKVTPQTFSKWKKNGFPPFFETFCTMCRKTGMKDYELCRIFGVEYKGTRTREAD